MSDQIKYPNGIQTFGKIREGGYLYVDKTGLIHRLVNNNTYVFLSRPRRFGKSLLLSTIEAYFLGQRHLFEGLAASRLEKEWKVHPVFRIDLSGESYENPGKLFAKIDSILARWENHYGKSPNDTTIATRFSGLIHRAFESDGERVVVLIDEYDKPLLENILDDTTHSAIRDSLRGFYSVIKECDQYIRFAMLTGITKFSHLSVFSGLNNLRDISFNPQYNAICGISETEFRHDFIRSVAEFSVTTGTSESETWDKFKENYDGYRFCARGEGIYNPYSVLNAFDDCLLSRYWFRTGTPMFLVSLFTKYNFPLWELEGTRKTLDDLSDMTAYGRNLVALLYQAGYLTIKGYDDFSEQYILGFPNKEVETGFWNSLYKDYIFKTGQLPAFSIDRFIDDVARGNADGFMTRLQSLVSSLQPGNETRREVHFQNVMQIIFKMLGFRTHTEISSSYGRADMIVETPSFVYIFEFKINSSSGKAMAQIHEKGYADPFRADTRKVFLIGASFSTETSTIDSYEIETVM